MREELPKSELEKNLQDIHDSMVCIMKAFYDFCYDAITGAWFLWLLRKVKVIKEK